MLEDLKKRLVKIAKDADSQGLCKHKSGNFSIKDEKSEYILITPSAVSREELNENHICVVDMDLNLIEVHEKVRPSSELLMHIEVYKCRSDVKAIVHTHSKFATAFSVVSKEIPPIVYEIVNVIGGEGRIKISPYKRPGTIELAKSIIGVIKNNNACLMANHGVLTVSSKDIEDAYLKAAYVEEVAEIYYNALQINRGEEPELIPEQELELWKYPDEINY